MAIKQEKQGDLCELEAMGYIDRVCQKKEGVGCSKATGRAGRQLCLVLFLDSA